MWFVLFCDAVALALLTLVKVAADRLRHKEKPMPECGHEGCPLCDPEGQPCEVRTCRFCLKRLCHDCMIDHHHPKITWEPVDVTW